MQKILCVSTSIHRAICGSSLISQSRRAQLAALDSTMRGLMLSKRIGAGSMLLVSRHTT